MAALQAASLMEEVCIIWTLYVRFQIRIISIITTLYHSFFPSSSYDQYVIYVGEILGPANSLHDHKRLALTTAF